MKRMLIDANHPEEMRVAIADNKQILEFDFVSAARPQIKGNVYLAKVTRVEPSLQAAFIEYGNGRQGFLPFSEIHPDYYQIPVSDRQKLMEEVERELQEEAAEEDAEIEAASQPKSDRAPRKRRPRTRRRRGGKDAAGDESGKDGAASDDDADQAKPATEASTDAPTKEAPKAEKSDSKDDTPPTQYAKKDEPSAKSDVVEKGSEAAEADEKPKTRRRPSLLRKPRVKKADAEKAALEEAKKAEEAAAKSEAKSDDAAENVSDNTADKLAITPPVETNLGAALFSEAEAFDALAEKAQDAAELADADDDDDMDDDGADDAAEDQGIETLDSEEEAVKPARSKKRVPFFKRYKIQEVVKRGQVVLVQVVKEERGNKGASVTTYLSLAGRYCVLMPNSPRDGGVSRKISDSETRKRLKDVMSQLVLAKGMSVIIRTAGIDRNRSEIRRDFDYLVKLWNQIRDTTLQATAPALIYEENNLIKRAIRDLYTSDIDHVLVEGEAAYTEARDFMQMLMPSHTSRVKQYKADMPLFYEHGIEDQLASMHDPEVKLKSGGYLVINPTEALISIDVNSGRSTGERNIEETATKNNIEAAHEVARQLRLRDLAGLVVIDFIDMMDSRNRRAVERNLKDALRSDRAKIQVGRISPFGLMEMSRQRLRPSIGEAMHTTCPTCAGGGLVRAPESLALHIVRTLEKEAVSGRWGELKLRVSASIALFLLNQKRSQIAQIEQHYDVVITVDIDETVSISDFALDRTKAQTRRRPVASKYKDQGTDSSEDDADTDTDTPDTKDHTDTADTKEPRRRSRGGRGRGRSAKSDSDDTVIDNPPQATKDAPKDAKPSAAKAKPASTKADQAEDEAIDGKTEDLPEFTKQPVATKKEAAEDKVVSIEQVSAAPAAPAAPATPPEDITARPAGAPPRKGWWQQMIELD